MRREWRKGNEKTSLQSRIAFLYKTRYIVVALWALCTDHIKPCGCASYTATSFKFAPGI